MLHNIRIWSFSLIENKDFWLGVTIWLFLLAPIEMLIHECGHIYIALKYGIKCRYIKFGIGQLLKWKLKNGIRFYIGIPAAYVATRFTGDEADKNRAKDDPQSFSYSKRHPKERVFVALAGSIAVFWVVASIFGLWIIIAKALMLSTPFYIKTAIGLIWTNELMNLILPIRFSKRLATDSRLVLENLWQWIQWKKHTD